MLSLLLLLVPAAYQALAIAAGLLHLSKRAAEKRQALASTPVAVSVLKPLRGLDPNTEAAFLSQVTQDLPEFEVLFGVSDPNDAAASAVRRLQTSYPQAAIRLFVSDDPAPNGKVGVLMKLAAEARYPVWVVNDSDICVGPDYLRRVTAPLADSRVGVVTCPYSARAHNLPAAWEAFGIATDFMPSTLVAPLVGVREFGLGSTLAFRAADLQQAGGFAAFAEYIADDYQLAKRITALGKRALLSTYAVETSLGEDTWAGIWRHQLRWARTIRTSKGAGYAGLPITQAGLWMVALLLTGHGAGAATLWLLRSVSGFLTGGLVLGRPSAMAFAWLAPLWDLYAFSIWLCSYASRQVKWRDRALRIDPAGRIR